MKSWVGPGTTSWVGGRNVESVRGPGRLVGIRGRVLPRSAGADGRSPLLHRSVTSCSRWVRLASPTHRGAGRQPFVIGGLAGSQRRTGGVASALVLESSWGQVFGLGEETRGVEWNIGSVRTVGFEPSRNGSTSPRRLFIGQCSSARNAARWRARAAHRRAGRTSASASNRLRGGQVDRDGAPGSPPLREVRI